jgi:LysW-gamma-L-lysine carboxypeptidase
MLSFDYHFTQPSAHGAAEQTGAAEKAVTFWNALMDYAEDYNGGQSERFNTLDPALRVFNTFSDGLHDGADMNIVMRIPLGFRVPELKQRIQAWCNGATLKYHPSDPPFQAEKNTPLVRAILRAIRAEGGRPRFKLKTGTADMNIVGPVWGCPIVAYGPGDSALDHTPEEHIELAEFQRAIDVLARALGILVSCR